MNDFVDLTPERIRWIKNHAGDNNTKVTTEVFARMLGGAGQQTVSRWMNGHHPPHQKYQRKLQQLYQVIKARKTKKLSRPPDIPGRMTISI